MIRNEALNHGISMDFDHQATPNHPQAYCLGIGLYYPWSINGKIFPRWCQAQALCYLKLKWPDRVWTSGLGSRNQPRVGQFMFLIFHPGMMPMNRKLHYFFTEITSPQQAPCIFQIFQHFLSAPTDADTEAKKKATMAIVAIKQAEDQSFDQSKLYYRTGMISAHMAGFQSNDFEVYWVIHMHMQHVHVCVCI